MHLPQLVCRVEEASSGSGIQRLERVYDRIYIDEVQDLCGYDLEVLKLLMNSVLPIEMVGDIRQAILVTNEREQKNDQYKYMKVWTWFRQQEAAGRLRITQRCETWRCHPEIASFADSLFGNEWGFERTVSLNTRSSGHDGIFLVAARDVEAYLRTFAPMAMRYSASSGKTYTTLDFTNFGKAKGLGRERVLICPTAKIAQLLRSGKMLDSGLAAHLYVAVTRAEQSVAFILDTPGSCEHPYWSASGAESADGSARQV